MSMLLVCACATAPAEPEEPLIWTAEWFQCKGRFQCIVVYDAFCNFTPVNAQHARTYEKWAHQEVRRIEERLACPPAAGQPVPLPHCRKGQCDVF